MPSFSDITLHTTRLLLRPLRPDDATQLFAIHADAEFMRYWSTPPWTSIEQAHSLIERDQRAAAANDSLRLGLVLRESSQLVGTCSLFGVIAQCRRAEFGYGIARPYWRRGYQFEAASAVIALAFGELGLNRLEADVDPRNEPSARSLEKLGFVREGLLRERWIVGDEVSDSALYGLLAREWRERPAA